MRCPTLTLGLLFLLGFQTVAIGDPRHPRPARAPRGQATRWSVAPAQAPLEVRDCFERYLHILRTSRSLDDCAAHLLPIAGGGLVNEDGASLRTTVAEYSLRKDFQAIAQYDPDDRITRIEASTTTGHGFGPSAIRGTLYRIWLAKRDGAPGLPAPVQILLPEGHATIHDPRVVGIGSL